MFVMKSAMVVRKELDTAKWDEEKMDKMYKSSTARFDAVEALRYAAMEHPEPSKVGGSDESKYFEMEKKDPATAKEWREYDRRIAARAQHGKITLRDMDTDESSAPLDFALKSKGRFDWED